MRGLNFKLTVKFMHYVL